MPKINVYLPDELAAEVKNLELPVSAICQRALEEAVQQLRATKEQRSKSILALFTDTARLAVARAEDEARELNHSVIGTEHLLLALLKVEGLSQVLVALEITRDDIKRAVMGLVEPGTTPVEERPAFSARAKYGLETAFRETLRMGTKQVRPGHLLLGLARDEDSMAAKALARLDVDYGRVRTATQATMLSVVVGATRMPAYRSGRRALKSKEMEVAVAGHGGSMAGLTSLVEMHMNELKDAISAQLEELTRERDAERTLNVELWEKLREHGIDPDETKESTT